MAYGTVNADVIQSSVANTSLGAGDASIMKNRIINGAMVIDQRNAGASITANNGTFCVDRFKMSATKSGFGTFQQNAGSVTPPVGFSNYLGFTSTASTSVATGDLIAILHRIEGYNIADLNWGTANAKTVTLSFWVYSSLTGTFGGGLGDDGGDYTYPFSYSIPVANTWTQISITITGATSGTWLKTNGIGINLSWSLGTGSTFSGTAGSWTSSVNAYNSTGSVNVVATNGATFYITGVQLEVGSSATGYEYRQYGQELALCQRYCYVISGNSPYQNGYSRYPCFGSGTNGCIWYAQYPVQMRTSPSLITNSFTSSSMELYNYNTATAPTFSAITIAEGDVWHGQVVITSTNNIVSGNIVSWRWQNIQNAYVGFSAEL